MSFAFMPVYTGDYLRDTRHLTPLKHGIYLMLLMHCWDQKGPLPRDEQECAGIANCRSADEVDALRYVLSRYFTLMEDGWYNKRMQLEVERAESISTKREDAGRRGANERMRRFRESQALAKQLLNKSQASDATPTPTPTLTPTLTPTPTPTPTAVVDVLQISTVSSPMEHARERAKKRSKKSGNANDALADGYARITGELSDE